MSERVVLRRGACALLLGLAACGGMIDPQGDGSVNPRDGSSLTDASVTMDTAVTPDAIVALDAMETDVPSSMDVAVTPDVLDVSMPPPDAMTACFRPTQACTTGAQCCTGLACDTTTLGRVCCGNAGASCTRADGADCCRDLECVSGRCVAPAACIRATGACTGSGCCAGLTCGTTTLGRVCCGNAGAACTRADGADCCGALECVSGRCTAPGGAPDFEAPFPCNETWTYSHHSAEVRQALDFINTAGATDNKPVLASARGVATRRFEAGGAGNYIVINHGGGWTTYYFHLQSFSVASGTMVEQGREVGRVGSTGASSGPHLHYEQLRGGVGQVIRIHGASLAPYPGSYGSRSIRSMNCP